MKSYLFTILALALFTSSVQAQHVNVGIKGGLNVYNVAGNQGSGNDSRIGFNLGLLGHIHKNSHFALQPEIFYSLQGNKYRADGRDVNVNLNYVNIPVLFQYMFDNGFRLQAGPQLGLLASAQSVINENSTDVSSEYRGMDLGISAGLSYVNPPTGFGLDLRYNYGFSDIRKHAAIDSYNRGVQLGVFYIFDRSHKAG